MSAALQLQQGITDAEWHTRCELAALYHVIHHFGWTDGINTHMSARVPGEPHHFLINNYGETFDEISVPVLTPREAKGLEFDHVIVVEPALIVEEGGDSGLRELYVALTRPTKTLIVVHAQPLPDALDVSG